MERIHQARRSASPALPFATAPSSRTAPLPARHRIHRRAPALPNRTRARASGTVMLGVSPEFEIALYTLFFLCGDFAEHDGQSSRTPARIGPYSVDVICHKQGAVRYQCP